MRVAILHNAVARGAPADERDVLVQVGLVGEALDELGHELRAIPVDLDLADLRARLASEPFDVAFNLVESIEGFERLILAVPALLESLGLPFTGARLGGLVQCADKVLAKRLLRAEGLPTPPWSTAPGPDELRADGGFVVKPRWEHGSVGLHVGCVPRGGVPEGAFVEAFVDGRELNLSLLADPGGLKALPAAEILFVDFGDRPRVVDYRAKWEPGSFEYEHTPRSFEFGADDAVLVESLESLAVRAATCLGLTGYARVDFRVDGEGQPYVLEVNANPCLAPDAGFLAAAERAGLGPSDVVARILRAALPAGSARTRSHS